MPPRLVRAASRRVLGVLLARSVLLAAIAVLFPLPASLLAGGPDLGARLEPLLRCLGGREARFALSISIDAEVETTRQRATIRIERIDDESFTFALEHKDYPLRLERTGGSTTLFLPAHGAAFTGAGPVAGLDTLAPKGLAARLFSEDSAAFAYANILTSSTGPLAARLLEGLAGLRSEDGKTWSAAALGGARMTFGEKPWSVEVSLERASLRVELEERREPSPQAAAPPAGVKLTAVDRTELERVFVRGPRRSLEVLAPSPRLADPPRERRRTPHGELRWLDGMRLLLLSGTPREAGEAHGRLLADEARRCLDSTVYLVGGADTITKGRWFLDDLRSAWRRLERHIPADHLAEIDALADAAALGRDELRLANVFPELFHCSGFAVFGKATADGKLYHGRVLDYMTVIGLQDAAAVIVEAIDGKIPFANVGYAGFAGSVSGMNAKQISLGEMGGRGEGQWDGVPMATLMRRALEECSTLDEVKRLWSVSPRTCEYYYVFADGKVPSAVGVSATPAKIEFVLPGQAHPLLGDGIEDAVVLSAGDRLKTLRERVTELHGRIDVETALWLMSRPVAMNSNLHNALFIPQDLVLHVAHADRKEIAAKRPYTRVDLGALLRELPGARTALR